MANTIPYDVQSGEAPQVAKDAIYPKDYELGKSLGDASKADLLKGYCSYGKSVGEKGSTY